MSFALNEVDAMARKAARGAGFSWGMAEETGRAARWLCAQGIDGVQALAALLGRADGAALVTMEPAAGPGHALRTQAGAICPLMAGAALADSAEIWAADGLQIGAVLSPALLLPFAAIAAAQLGTPISVTWDGVAARTDGTRLSLTGSDDLLAPQTAQATVRSGGKLAEPLTRRSRAAPADADWATLNCLAGRTHAPATEDSRLKGAGAGLSDND